MLRLWLVLTARVIIVTAQNLAPGVRTEDGAVIIKGTQVCTLTTAGRSCLGSSTDLAAISAAVVSLESSSAANFGVTNGNLANEVSALRSEMAQQQATAMSQISQLTSALAAATSKLTEMNSTVVGLLPTQSPTSSPTFTPAPTTPPTGSPTSVTSGFVSFSADFHNSYDSWSSTSSGVLFKNTFCYAWSSSNKQGKGSRPRVGVIRGRRGTSPMWNGSPRNRAANWMQSSRNVRFVGCAEFNDACLAGLDIIYHIQDNQQPHNIALTDAEAVAIKRFVQQGGSVVGYIGHLAERVRNWNRWASRAFGINLIGSQCHSPGYANARSGAPAALVQNCGGRVERVTWGGNCHEHITIQSGSRAVVAFSGQQHNEQVIVPVGAYDNE